MKKTMCEFNSWANDNCDKTKPLPFGGIETSWKKRKKKLSVSMNNVEQLLIKYIEIKTWKMIEGEIDPGKRLKSKRRNYQQMFWSLHGKGISVFFFEQQKNSKMRKYQIFVGKNVCSNEKKKEENLRVLKDCKIIFHSILFF